MLVTLLPPHVRHSGPAKVAVGPGAPAADLLSAALSISTQDHDPLVRLADHGQRQRSLPSLALTKRDYSVGLNVVKLSLPNLNRRLGRLWSSASRTERLVPSGPCMGPDGRLCVIDPAENFIRPSVVCDASAMPACLSAPARCHSGGVSRSRKVWAARSALCGSRTTAIATAADRKMTGTAVTHGGRIIARVTAARHLTIVVRVLVMTLGSLMVCGMYTPF